MFAPMSMLALAALASLSVPAGDNNRPTPSLAQHPHRRRYAARAPARHHVQRFLQHATDHSSHRQLHDVAALRRRVVPRRSIAQRHQPAELDEADPRRRRGRVGRLVYGEHGDGRVESVGLARRSRRRTRRYIHTGLMLASDAGFLWTAAIGGEAKHHYDAGVRHQNVALGSIGLSTLGTALMWFWKD